LRVAVLLVALRRVVTTLLLRGVEATLLLWVTALLRVVAHVLVRLVVALGWVVLVGGIGLLGPGGTVGWRVVGLSGHFLGFFCFARGRVEEESVMGAYSVDVDEERCR